MSEQYTKLALREDVPDSAAGYGIGHLTEARFATETLGGETGLSYHHLKPGKRQPFGHRHEQAEEVYVVLAGGGRVRIDDELVPLAALDAIRIAPSAVRCFEAGPEGLQMLAVGPHHEGDGQMLPEFWPADAE